MSKLLLLSILLIGCTATKKLNSKYIELQRTPCFGFCPDYKLTLFENGEYVFKGSGYVLNKRTEKGKISPVEVDSIFNIAKAINFSSLPKNIDEICVSSMTDQPEVKITIAYTSVVKSVREQSCALIAEPILGFYHARVETGILTEHELDSMLVQSKKAEVILNDFHNLANRIDSVTNTESLIKKLNKYQ
ncbi:MAG: hypothetical protein BalsKO_11530 [Balneolaceae bacterium]